MKKFKNYEYKYTQLSNKSQIFHHQTRAKYFIFWADKAINNHKTPKARAIGHAKILDHATYVLAT